VPHDPQQINVGLAFVLDDEPKIGTVVCKALSGIGVSARPFASAEKFLHEVSRSSPVDDFGTAYASLSRLTDLPFVELKLDRSFVSNCASDKLKYALCQTVVDLAHRFQASLCAEGVETADDLRCVTKLGFDSAQGYFLAKPMSSDRLLASLLSHNGRSPAGITSQAPDELLRSATV
jgi:predicted signal transduction protein with EAL and GGDEF domain